MSTFRKSDGWLSSSVALKVSVRVFWLTTSEWISLIAEPGANPILHPQKKINGSHAPAGKITKLKGESNLLLSNEMNCLILNVQ